MSLRPRDVILACIAAFIAWGWATWFIPSIRFVPQALVVGFLLAILAVLALFATTAQTPIQRAPRKNRHVAFVRPQLWASEKAALQTRLQYRPKDLYPASRAVSKSFEDLLSLIERDFIETWYSNMSKRPTFTNEVDRAIRQALANLIGRAKNVDLVGTAVSRVVPIVTGHMNETYEAEKAVRGKKLNKNITESEELDLAVATKFRNGKLHMAASLAFADTKVAQQQYLRGMIMRLLPKIMPQDMLSSPAVTVLIKEIVSCAVLQPVMQLLCDPDTWNQILEGVGKSLLQDRKTVRKLRAALDEHAPQSPKTERLAPFPKLSVTDNDRQFEKFIRVIRQCNNLSDARRFRSEIAGQLVREGAVEDQDPLFLRRLETGKRILDQKIAIMGARGSTPTKPRATNQNVVQAVARHQPKSPLEHATLREILYNASGLTSFMEYMDRQGLMRLVQFWIVVDGFRNPLEADADDVSVPLSSKRTWSESDRADILQINDAYLSLPEVKTSAGATLAIKTFLEAGSRASDVQFQAARKAILQTQTAVYGQMNDPFFANFRRSDLWFKLLAIETSTPAAPPAPMVSPIEANGVDLAVKRPAVAARHSTQTAHVRIADLKRAASSTTDLRSSGSHEPASPTRRSFEVGMSRTPLFEDDIEPDPMSYSTASVRSDGGSDAGGGNPADEKVVSRMQSALNDILDDEPTKGALFSDDDIKSPADELSGSGFLGRPVSPSTQQPGGRPNIASLGLVGDSARRGFLDDNIFGEEEKFLEDEREDSDADKNLEDEIQHAAPGDLGLAEAIDALTLDIEKLVSQEAIIDSLTKKAELTNNIAELRILKKSKSSIQREINRKELQRQQYIVQESDNSLYGRATISIQSIMVGQEEDGKEYALCKPPPSGSVGSHSLANI